MADFTYRMNDDGVLMRDDERCTLRGLRNGRWEWWDGLVADWYFKSLPAEESDLVAAGIDKSDDEFDTTV